MFGKADPFICAILRVNSNSCAPKWSRNGKTRSARHTSLVEEKGSVGSSPKPYTAAQIAHLDTYLDTWSGFEAAKTAPWPSRGLHHCGKFLEPSDE